MESADDIFSCDIVNEERRSCWVEKVSYDRLYGERVYKLLVEISGYLDPKITQIVFFMSCSTFLGRKNEVSSRTIVNELVKPIFKPINIVFNKILDKVFYYLILLEVKQNYRQLDGYEYCYLDLNNSENIILE